MSYVKAKAIAIIIVLIGFYVLLGNIEIALQ